MKIINQLEKNPTEKHAPLLARGDMVQTWDQSSAQSLFKAEIVQRVGLGTHAEVYEARLFLGPKAVDLRIALKVEKPLKIAHGHLARECDILRHLNSSSVTPRYLAPFIVEIAGVNCLAAGMELFDESLSAIKVSGKLVTEPDRRELLDWLLVQMFLCVFEVHTRGFLHRDIKPSNFMYKLGSDGQLRVVLVDFGSAVPLDGPNEKPFRGTGAYSSPMADPMQFRPVDDYWSVAFSILELTVEGGLPWRSISGRTEDGRAGIQTKKLSMIQSIVNEGEFSITNLTRKVFQFLIDGDLQGVQGLIHSFSPIPLQDRILSILHPSNFSKLDLPRELKKIHPLSLLTCKEYRSSLAHVTSHCTPFPLKQGVISPPNLQEAVLSVLAQIGVDAESNQILPLCMFQARGQECEIPNCPLIHIPGIGFARSVVLRKLRRNPICFQHVIAGKCGESACTFTHPSCDEIREVFHIR
jgi:serine/threonine protein kinase